jgi:hypothetical protein
MTTPGDPHREPAPPGEWLFEKEGRVYGPVAGDALVDLLYRGEVDARTPVAGPEGGYRPIVEVAGFALHVRKAEARLRVEREVTGARQLARRRRLQGVALVAVLGAAAAAGAGAYAFRLARERPAEARSALLEDFGGGIAVAAPAQVAAGGRAAEPEEVEIPPDVPGGPAGPGARVPPRAPARPAGGLVQSNWDGAHIQAVVAREQRTLVPCIRAEADRARDWSGEIPLEFAIGNDGRIARLWIDGPRGGSAELRGCLLEAMKGWAFRPFAGERPVVSLSFRVGGR